MISSTGSKDAEILQGQTAGVTVCFVDDWEGEKTPSLQDTVVPTPSETLSVDDDEPDWLLLEKELQAKYAENAKDPMRIEMEEKTKLPLRGRWCSAY